MSELSEVCLQKGTTVPDAKEVGKTDGHDAQNTVAVANQSSAASLSAAIIRS